MATSDTSLPKWARTRNAKRVESIQKATRDGVWKLGSSECWWRDRFLLLKSYGYVLRPRFRPGWVPSWLGNDRIPSYCEDSAPLMHPKTIDAIRISDQMAVCIKKVPKGSSEITFCKFLMDNANVNNRQNHCVPILDVLSPNSEPEFDFIVMPLLRPFNDPSFFSINEVLDFMRQTLEGLCHMHAQGIAHRDCSNLNIMCDAKSLYPEGFHPTVQDWSPDMLHVAKVLRRSDAQSVKYYFTDFGLSTRFDSHQEIRLVTGTMAQDRDVPELSSDVPYDPFAVDIFTLGKVYQNELISKFSNLSFLEPLTTTMTQRNPKLRPTAAKAFTQFEALLKERNQVSLKWRLQPIQETSSERVIADLSFLLGQLIKRPFFLAAVLVSAAGSALSILYGPRAVINRLKSLMNRVTLR